MIGVLVNNQPLDLTGVASVRFELNSPIFTDPESTIGSFSFPFDLIANCHNNKILGFPTLEDSAEDFNTEFDGIFEFAGNQIFKGKLHIVKPNNKTIKVAFVIQNLSKLKDLNLKDVEFDGLLANFPEGSLLAHANATTQPGSPYPYVFYPVYNPCFFSDANDPGTVTSDFQNYWDMAAGSFVQAGDQLSAMPFLKLDYVLEKLFEHCEIPFENKWQDTEELKNLTLYNNFSIYNNGSFSNTLNLNNHVPSMLASEFITQLSELFKLSFSQDIFNSGVCLTPSKDLIKDFPNRDWTDYADCNFNICPNNNLPSKICFSRCSLDNFHRLTDHPAHYIVVDGYDPINGYPNYSGFIWDSIRNEMYYQGEETVINLPNGQTLIDRGIALFGRIKPCKDLGGNGKPQKLDLQPLFQDKSVFTTGVPVQSWLTPVICTEGTIQDLNQYNDMPLKLMFYRGMHLNPATGLNYPLATNGIYDESLNQVGDCSLHLIGENGICEKWHKGVPNYNRTIGKFFNVPFKELMTFSFDDLIRDKNQKYMVKKMGITFTCEGLKPIKASLVNIL